MASTKLYCVAFVSMIFLFGVKASIGAHFSLHRRDVQPVKQEKVEPTEASASTVGSSVPSLRPKLKEAQRECTRFEHMYCNNQFGYQYGLFPNHKGQTAKEAATELNHFAQLFESGCSDKIGVFLCFTYFPLCTPPIDDVLNVDNTQLNDGPAMQLQEVLPCKETCEEVHKSECSEYVLNATGGDAWPEHLSCNQAIFKPVASKQCASGESSDDNEESTNNGGNDNDSEMCQAAECSSKCAVRKNCNRGTFKNPKNTYKFAAKVTVEGRLNSQSCKHAYNISVEEQFNLLSCQPNTNNLTRAPTLEDYTIIHTSPANCEECLPLITGSTYLIAGQYHVKRDGSVVWELPNSRVKSLASKWVEDYDEKLQEWIDGANEANCM